MTTLKHTSLLMEEVYMNRLKNIYIFYENEWILVVTPKNGVEEWIQGKQTVFKSKEWGHTTFAVGTSCWCFAQSQKML